MAHDTLFAVSFQIGDGGDGCPSTGMNRISADARRLQDQPLSSPFGLHHRNDGTALCRYDATGRQSTVTRRSIWERVFVRFRRWPTSGSPDPVVWSLKGNVESTPALIVRVSTSGALTLYNQGNQTAPGEALGSKAMILGRWYCIEIHAEFNDAVAIPPNPPYENNALVEMRVDSAVVAFSNRFEKPTDYGIDRRNQVAIESRLGDASNFGKGHEIDYADWIADGVDWVGKERRVTLARPVSAGSHNEWTIGNSDVRHQTDYPFFTGNVGSVSTQTGDARQTYTVESLSSLGITGEIFSARVAVALELVPAGDVTLIVRRNGSDSYFNIGPAPQGAWSTWRVPTSGWAPSDEIQVGIRNVSSPGGDTTRLGACALLVEHDTPPWTLAAADGAVRVLETSYTGNGTQQTVSLSALDSAVTSLVPSFIAVLPQSGSSPGAWWWDSRVYPSATNNVGPLWGIVPGRGEVVVTGSNAATNQNGITYTLVACFDPLQRAMARGAVALAAGSGDRDVALPPGFTPDATFIARERAYLNDTTRTFYRGAGHTGDQSVSLGANVSAISGAILSWGAGVLEVGTLIKELTQDFSFMAVRTEHFSQSRLVAVTSFVGNGSNPRVISVDLDGATPVYASCVPTNTGQRWTRYGGVTRQWSGNTAGSANAITAFGSDSMTVGSELNVSGVTYSVFALAAGVDPAPARPLILMIGYWPPTDVGNMLSAFSSRQQYRKLNGQLTNYDVLALSATYAAPIGTWPEPSTWPFWGGGSGSFRVDYKNTADSFWDTVPGLAPVALLSFSWMGTPDSGLPSWKIEADAVNRAQGDWITPIRYNASGTTELYTIDAPYIGGSSDDPSPFQGDGAILGNPPDRTVPAGATRNGLDAVTAAAIAAAVNTNTGLSAGLGPPGSAGRYVSEFIGYHVAWYRSLNPSSCVFAGHTHVAEGTSAAIGETAVRSQLDVILDALPQ